MPVPVHELATTEEFLPVLDGFPTKFPPGERFAYCNGGYVVLALLAERAAACRSTSSCTTGLRAGRAWSTPRSCAPTSCPGAPRSATSTSTALADQRVPPAGARQRRRRDLHDRRRRRAFWAALFAGRIVPPDGGRDGAAPQRRARGADALRPRLLAAPDQRRRSCSRAATPACRSAALHDPTRAITYTVMSNTSEGAWPVTRVLAEYAGRTNRWGGRAGLERVVGAVGLVELFEQEHPGDVEEVVVGDDADQLPSGTSGRRRSRTGASARGRVAVPCRAAHTPARASSRRRRSARSDRAVGDEAQDRPVGDRDRRASRRSPRRGPGGCGASRAGWRRARSGRRVPPRPGRWSSSAARPSRSCAATARPRRDSPPSTRPPASRRAAG